jgi:D-serine deaminase-like pyridoxal phosphate-dependent protein
VEIARLQRRLGAAGLTCQKLGEAETMVDAGFDDVLIPYNILGEQKLARLARLLERARVTVSVDDPALLPGLDGAAANSGRELHVVVECDTGLHRTGVPSPTHAADLAAEVARSSSLRFGGFLTYPAPPAARAFLAEAAQRVAERRLEVDVISAGGTPSMWSSGDLRPVVNEYRVGTYAFHDRSSVAAGAASLEEVALTVAATVVSRPTSDRAILDAGSKSLTSDRGPDPGYGLILEAPRSKVTRLDEEHAYVELAAGENLELGQQVRVVPNHACVVSNLFDEFVVVRGAEVVGRWQVDARGRSS